ncbi:MAG: ribosome biogenesis GTP-binding protein YihA/YsxC [Coriobacteriia bacterium]|nr:ribosome biogenesis GTP-binding protein YihA/YsxC [Coriobacteriia bacterium]
MTLSLAIRDKNIKFVAAYGVAPQLPKSEKPEIAFVGRSNVGKSSLINKLTKNKKLAKTSSKPGKTITINFFDADNFHLVDLPGYGYSSKSQTEESRWSKLIESYFNDNRMFSLIVLLIDIRHNPTKLDIQMIDYLCELGLPFCIALTKADKLSKQKVNNINLNIEVPVIKTSAISGLGIDELDRTIQYSLLQ